MTTEMEKMIEANKRKWEKAKRVKEALIKEHGELIGLILYRQYLEKMEA